MIVLLVFLVSCIFGTHMISLRNSGWVNPTFTCCELLDEKILNHLTFFWCLSARTINPRDSDFQSVCTRHTFGTTVGSPIPNGVLQPKFMNLYSTMILATIMTSQPSKAKALLLPTDGSGVRLVSYNIKRRDDNDMVDNGLAEFYDRIPDLKTWLDGGYQQRAMASFHVGIKENNKRSYSPGLYFLTGSRSFRPILSILHRIFDLTPQRDLQANIGYCASAEPVALERRCCGNSIWRTLGHGTCLHGCERSASEASWSRVEKGLWSQRTRRGTRRRVQPLRRDVQYVLPECDESFQYSKYI